MADFIHTEKIGNALIARLSTNLNDDTLKSLALGDFSEYLIRGDSILDDCPAIFVAPLTVTPAPEAGGIGGVTGTREEFRIHMFRKFTTGTTVMRDKVAYMKTLLAAIFSAWRLEIDGVQVIRIEFVNADYAGAEVEDLLAPLWCISVDIAVICRTGGD